MESAVGIYNDEARAGSFIISEGFEREHFKVLRLIEKYKERFIRLDNKRLSKSLIIRRVPAKKAGRPIDEIMLNEAQSIFLGTLFRNTDRVLDFKEKLARDFVTLKTTLANVAAQQNQPKWIEKRVAGKVARLDETNEIKRFVQYCQDNGSTNAKTYYCNLTKMVNKTMYEFTGSFKNLRDVMTTRQLEDTYFHDNIVRRALSEGMAANMDYHDIYQMVKSRIMTLAEMTGKAEIISKQLSLLYKV